MSTQPTTIEDLIDDPDQDFRATFHEPDLLLAGRKFAPFSAFRRAVAQAMGMKWGNLRPEEIEEIKNDETGETVSVSYPGLPRDVTVVSYLCTREESEVLKADANPKKAIVEAFAWAQEVGLIFPSDTYARASALVSQAFANEAAANAQPVQTEGSGKKKG
jgi:hypothetical protein